MATNIKAINVKLAYEKLLEIRDKTNLGSDQVLQQLESVYDVSQRYLRECKTGGLLSKVKSKNYFLFENNGKFSRPVNSGLYSGGIKQIGDFFSGILHNDLSMMSEEKITSACYVVAMSYCAAIDIIKKKADKKTPGTYFEVLVGHIYSRKLGLLPSKQVEVLNLDMDNAKLPTDFIFDLGKKKPKFHVPVKTSTRERVIQVWAHQRVLDGVYGVGRFLGTLVCMAETKLSTDTGTVVEICLPIQWQLYQMYIAQMKRIYYLDMPAKYEMLNNTFPKIPVRPFGQFFKDIDSLVAGSSD